MMKYNGKDYISIYSINLITKNLDEEELFNNIIFDYSCK